MYEVITRWVQGGELYCVVRRAPDGTVAELIMRTRDKATAYSRADILGHRTAQRPAAS